jgi:hypothetical protein
MPSRGVPFFFKQWGEWKPNGSGSIRDNSIGEIKPLKDFADMVRVSKKAAGAILNGREHCKFPEATHVQ